MTRNLTQPKQKPLHPRDRRSPRHAEWKENIREGKLEASRRRKRRGLYTPRELALETRLASVNTVRDLIKRGILPVFIVGTYRYVNRKDAERIIREQFRPLVVEGNTDAAA